MVLATVFALGTAGFLFLPAAPHLFEVTLDKLGKPLPVRPERIETSAEVPGHPARNTMDGLNNRYWGAPSTSASVTYTFRRPFRLIQVIITNGASPSPKGFTRQARALHVDMDVTTPEGTVHRRSLPLSDRPGPQPIPTGISDVKTVRLVLSSPIGLAEGRHIALAEVEFFQRGWGPGPAS